MAKDTKERMIEATARLIQLRGLHGVSLSEILSESGAPRGSLYFHFPGGKESVVLAAMQATINEATEILDACLTEATDPAAGVRAFFEAAAAEMANTEYAFGCPVAPIILDAPGMDSELASACRAALDEWTAMYRNALVAAGAEHGRAERLALTIVASLEGALIMARGTRDASLIREVGDEMGMMVSQALTPPHH
ncbi:TetR/AcrR family transcriptional regulator [Aquisalimonas asiatica]|uniref:Transcriptional regulator, TetR family n=1 Tax=Aquisalimonas asiatica TaxID=406100 RepID=A0A1H8Q067_9GAMM|nr:TetR/AcrR family transcriptional regulator [Aquisalimonas asiatica]SEO47580.1 transcriptional regulator, TetR family [Aquisalimonas asiatica]